MSPVVCACRYQPERGLVDQLPCLPGPFEGALRRFSPCRMADMPRSAPTPSMPRMSAARLTPPAFHLPDRRRRFEEAIAASENGEITVTFDAKSEEGWTAPATTSGMIPGKDPDAMVMVSAHYDAYFDGFQG